MSYQVLARKWRPRDFTEMAGQGHVLKTLISALDNQRLHHAYLFTGTRGVGKTTIARILARCLNCETGITSKPCGQCSACREISEGRFLDLIEVDAASRTKVEDTRELLENVQYAPSRGRFKVYLIDEVHMLSSHSFNALLKTLEEPPPHVKFLLATTDPHKLPVTVLSRCLQFNLKNLSPERLVDHIRHILEQEKIEFEEGALWQLGRAAQGSVRDCLTLLDQAIGFCDGPLGDTGVREFLGNIDQSVIAAIVDALIAQNAAAVLQQVAIVAEHAPDFTMILQELLSWLHRVAIAQVVPDGIDNSQGDRAQILAHASSLPAETVQLYYQIALKGKEDMPYAPDARSGLEMILLRMLAFTPAGMSALPGAAIPAPGGIGAALAPQGGIAAHADLKKKPVADLDHRADLPATAGHATNFVSSDTPVALAAAMNNAAVTNNERQNEAPGALPWEVPSELLTEIAGDAGNEAASEVTAEVMMNVTAPAAVPALTGPTTDIVRIVTMPQSSGALGRSASDNNEALSNGESCSPSRARTGPNISKADGQDAQTGELAEEKIFLATLRPESWTALFRQLSLTGVTRNIAANCVLQQVQGPVLTLVLEEGHATLFNDDHRKRMEMALSVLFEEPVVLQITIGQVDAETPAACRRRFEAQRQEQAVKNFTEDPLVRSIVERFGADIQVESITALTPFNW